MEHSVLVVLSPGFEEVEAITVIDLLRRAKIKVTTASLEEARTVMGSHGIFVTADMTLKEAENLAFSCIALPGGMRGVENMLENARLLAIVKRLHESKKIIAAVCAAPLILDKLEILREQHFTCHPCVHERIQQEGLEMAPVWTSGRIVTGRSAGCAMAWSLELIKVLLGEIPEAVLSGLRQP